MLRPDRIFPAFRAALAVLLAVTVAVPAAAQSLIRDPDIEYALDRLARPLITAAGLSPNRINVLVINDDRMNAFVIDDRAVFIHSGLILRLEDAAELQAVIGHELAHIANGHITRRMANRRSANTAAGIATALAAAAAIAGEPAAAGAAAVGATTSANRRYLSHTRAEEASADSSGLRYMAESGIDPQAMRRVLEKFRGQEVLSVGRQDPYVRAHPLTRDRLRAVEGLIAALDREFATEPEADYWFARAQGKLSAFLRAPSWTLRQVGRNDRSDVALMRRAVAYHRRPDPDAALREIDALAAKRPNDPFVHELRGQILLESRSFGAAITAYRRAAELAPGNALILGGLGRALLTREDAAGNRQALEVLENARSRDPRNPRMMRDLAVAYARAGNTGMASLATAERYALLGRIRDAAIHAKRAAGALPQGSPGWRRADDILKASRDAT
ncbi:MAG: M48 family metalloprotease [Rhodobacteraceae bacterium]|nr:M48 family metalloprotease [Paracoccaceae bacterium]